MTTIQLGPITFAETGAAGWVFSDLIDWFGQTDNKEEEEERPQGHGAFESSKALRTSRAISFNAAFLGGSAAEVEEAYDTLAAVGAEGPVEAIVTTSAARSARRVKVQVSSASDHHGRSTGKAAIDMIAADPRRYQVAADVPWVFTEPPSAGLGLVWPAVWPLIWPAGGVSGRITLTNSGKAPSAPMFRLLGGFTSALITTVETGARIGLDRLVPDGSYVDIDTSLHRATIDGQSDVSRWLRWREWALIPPGESRSYQFDVTAPEGAPKLGGRVLSAWW
ncbi:hypothetical protein [Microbacterium maritypicum]|uniref:Minor tail protein n=1 Tax=Microbacterium maritypicum MF109 TaxID=1333857 RepID=T5KUJ1_MICMQ|nr:hypothetical protein [Microbacterium liquefaciens]EQM83427.1 hypothetical protein L687_12470 [Microbacterium maritypicum MF109]